MRRLIVFSSETGNTQKLADTVADTLVTNYEISHINLAPSSEDFDLLFIGYKMNRGTLDDSLMDYLSTLYNKKVFLFGTMGANPNSPYGKLVKTNIEKLFSKNNTVIGHYLCQGKISEDIMERWFELAKNNPADIHACKQIENYDNAFSHPDSDDLLALRSQIVESLSTL